MENKLIEMMKKQGIDVNENSKMNELTIGFYSRKENKNIDISFQMEPLITVMKIQGHHVNFLNQKQWLSVFDYIESLPKITDKPFFIWIKDFLEEDKQMIKNVLRRKDYLSPNMKKRNEIDGLLHKYTFSAVRLGEYVCKESDINRLKRIIPLVSALNQCVQETIQGELLFDYRTMSFHAFDIYMHGFRGEMVLHVKKETCELVIKTLDNKELFNWVISKPADIQMCMNEFLSSVHKKTRIKNSLQPPDRFYKRWIREIANNKKEQYDMHQSFLTFFSPLEVEEFAAYFCKNAANDQKKKLDDRHSLYFYNEHVVLVAAQEGKIFVFEKNEQWKEQITNTLVELRRQFINNTLKDIS
jgi:hypothetical protein